MVPKFFVSNVTCQNLTAKITKAFNKISKQFTQQHVALQIVSSVFDYLATFLNRVKIDFFNLSRKHLEIGGKSASSSIKKHAKRLFIASFGKSINSLAGNFPVGILKIRRTRKS